MALKSDRFKGNPRLNSAANNAPTMRWGKRGAPIAIVQKAYVDLGFSMPISTLRSGVMDGIFGQETYSVTRHFQKNHSLGIDVIVGKQTMTKLDELFATQGPRPGPGPAGRGAWPRARRCWSMRCFPSSPYANGC